MTSLLFLIVIVLILAVNVALWKFGFVHSAEHPRAVLDKPVMNPRQKKAVLSRLNRWKKEKKLKLGEYKKFLKLCQEDWDPPTDH